MTELFGLRLYCIFKTTELMDIPEAKGLGNRPAYTRFARMAKNSKDRQTKVDRKTKIFEWVSFALKVLTLGLICISLALAIVALEERNTGETQEKAKVKGVEEFAILSMPALLFVLPIALIIGTKLMDQPIPKPLDLTIVILGALVFLTSTSFLQTAPQGYSQPIEATDAKIKGLEALHAITTGSLALDAIIGAYLLCRQNPRILNPIPY